jgi:hypothetical protein
LLNEMPLLVAFQGPGKVNFDIPTIDAFVAS